MKAALAEARKLMLDPASICFRAATLLSTYFNDFQPDDGKTIWRVGTNFVPAYLMEGILISMRLLTVEEIIAHEEHEFSQVKVRLWSLEIIQDPVVPPDEGWLERDGAVIGKISGIALPGGVQGTPYIP